MCPSSFLHFLPLTWQQVMPFAGKQSPGETKEVEKPPFQLGRGQVRLCRKERSFPGTPEGERGTSYLDCE